MPQPVETLADDFIQSLPCAINKPYPSTDVSFKNKEAANLLLDAFGGGDTAEFTAIAQYLQHTHTIENKEIANQIFCIALIEMRHLDLLGDMIVALGGDLRYWAANQSYWEGGKVSYGSNMCEKLSLDISSEQNAINSYHALIRNLEKLRDPRLKQVIDLINRIIEDEQLHLETFQTLYSKYCENKPRTSQQTAAYDNVYYPHRRMY